MTVCGQLASFVPFVQTSVYHSEERPFQSFSLEGLARSRVSPDSEGFGLQVFDTLPQGGRGSGQTEHKQKPRGTEGNVTLCSWKQTFRV